MSYTKAEDVLPKHLVEEIQQYVDGKLLYIPRKDENSLSWGEKSGTKEKLAKRNQTIVSRYYSGETLENLSKAYYLSEKRIQGILREYESSQKAREENPLPIVVGGHFPPESKEDYNEQRKQTKTL